MIVKDLCIDNDICDSSWMYKVLFLFGLFCFLSRAPNVLTLCKGIVVRYTGCSASGWYPADSGCTCQKCLVWACWFLFPERLISWLCVRYSKRYTGCSTSGWYVLLTQDILAKMLSACIHQDKDRPFAGEYFDDFSTEALGIPVGYQRRYKHHNLDAETDNAKQQALVPIPMQLEALSANAEAVNAKDERVLVPIPMDVPKHHSWMQNPKMVRRERRFLHYSNETSQKWPTQKQKPGMQSVGLGSISTGQYNCADNEEGQRLPRCIACKYASSHWSHLSEHTVRTVEIRDRRGG